MSLVLAFLSGLSSGGIVAALLRAGEKHGDDEKFKEAMNVGFTFFCAAVIFALAAAGLGRGE